MDIYQIKITDVGNQQKTLSIEGIFKAESLEDAKKTILKLCQTFFKLGEGEELLLIETPEHTFKHQTFGVCVGTADDWDCQGFAEIVNISGNEIDSGADR